MRILVINPFGGGEANARDNFDAIKRPDTDYDIVNIAEDYPLKNNQWLYFKYACTDPTLEKVLWGERQGYDGIFLCCQLDIGLYEARTLVDIPVTGTLESAALICYTMGKHFSLLSVDYKIQDYSMTDSTSNASADEITEEIDSFGLNLVFGF